LKDKVVLAYSGGLDTSVAIRWIAEKYKMNVIALSIDLGAEKDYEGIRKKALKVGAAKALVVDAKEAFINDYVFPALQADAIYEGQYTLATALARPLIAKLMVDVALNDQVRFDVAVLALAPQLDVIAPAREWGFTREETIEYAKRYGIPVPVTVKSPYSIDENLWGKSIECGILEDPWAEPPEEVFTWTKSPQKAPNKPQYVEVGFKQGIPVSLDGKTMGGVELVEKLNAIAGEHGVGRIDHLENRLVGIKSREVYEAPAATVLLAAHLALEQMTLAKDQLRFKARVAQEYADSVYNGLWFSAMHDDLTAYVKSTQTHVDGTVRVKLFKSKATVVGRKSPKSLYSYKLATYDKEDKFDQSASLGFIQIFGLPVKTQAQVQRKLDKSLRKIGESEFI
jgi:argininosuccinate synthase